MAEEVLFHIGMHKTGSTGIQTSMDAVSSGPDWRFIKFKRHNSTQYLNYAYPDGGFRWKRRNPKHRMDVASPQDARDLLVRTLHATKEPRAILSGEGLSAFSSVQTHAIADHLRREGFRLRVIGYIRPIYGFIATGLQQRLRERRVRFRDILSASTLHFDQRFGVWDDAFGADNVTLVPYLRDAFPDRSVIGDFAQRLGLGNLPELPRGANTGLGAEGVRLLWIWRQVQAWRGPGDADRVGRLRTLGDPPVAFSSALLAKTADLVDAQTTWVEARTGWRMPDDPGSDAPHAIGREADLYTISAQTCDWLAAETDMPATRLKSDIHAIAEAMGRLGQGGVEDPSDTDTETPVIVSAWDRRRLYAAQLRMAPSGFLR